MKNSIQLPYLLLFIISSFFACDDLLPDDISVKGLTNKISLNPTIVSDIQFRMVDLSSSIELNNQFASDYGFCWSTSPAPTLSNQFIALGENANSGPFTASIANLEPNTTYYTRSYAIINSNIVFGEEMTFTTNPAELPKLSTVDISEIKGNAAQSGGDIISDGGTDIMAKGICWNTSGNPNISDEKTIIGSGIGEFISPIVNLKSETTYYVKAYATNSLGTSYGEERTFQSGAYVTDPAGEVYPIVWLNGRTWLAKNMNYNVTGSYCYNDVFENCDRRGRLYPWDAANQACSSLGDGWRLPTKQDWAGLALSEGGYFDYIGVKWHGDYERAYNALTEGGSSGFDATHGSDYWSSTVYEGYPIDAYNYYFSSLNNWIQRTAHNKSTGLSCRCIKD